MNDLRDIYFDELVERFDLMANQLFSIGLSNERFKNVAVAWKKINDV